MTPASPGTGLVVAAHGQRGILECAGTRRPFVVKGRGIRAVCGDRVRFEQPPGSQALRVTAVEPRVNALSRTAPRDGQDEVIAANLTQIIAVCGPRPAPDWFLMDRYLCAAELMGCRAVIVWNKADLGLPDRAAADVYRRLGYVVLAVSTRTGAGLEALLALMATRISILAGQSGVGKSSLINALAPGAEAAIGELSAGDAVGMHTTTATLMYDVAAGGRLIDTPGVRDFLPAVPARRIDQGFPELRQLGQGCRFGDCTHLHEPGCAVKEAAASGALSARRYESYQRLMKRIVTAGG
jgi:ribosome biogenesis GTPase